jgi:hypothetical protein
MNSIVQLTEGETMRTKAHLGFVAGICLALQGFAQPIQNGINPVTGLESDGKYAVHGRVMGPDHQPLPFAKVETDGVGLGGGGASWGGSNGFPKQLMADTNGEFIVARDQNFERVQLRINAPGMAPLMVWICPSNTVQTVQMGVGSALRGRVLQDGKPLADVRVGVSGSDRNSEVWAGHFETNTDADGHFEFPHLPPDKDWEFFGVMNSFKPYGALSPRRVVSGNDGSHTDLGELVVVSGKHLAGQVRTSDGEPLPEGIKATVSYDNAWDSQTTDVDAEGRFRFEGLAAALLDVSVRARNWRLTGANRSLDLMNPFRLLGVLEGDKDDLVVMIDKGAPQYGSRGGTGNGYLPTQDQPQGRPLQGAEPGGPPLIVLAGQVVDDKTGKPLASYTVVPGYQPPKTGGLAPPKPLLQKMLEPFGRGKTVPYSEKIYWEYAQSQMFSNGGTFSMGFQPLTSTPVLRVESPGYEPFETGPTNLSITNLVIHLKKGVGPNGVVLLPNGRPAYGATLAFGAGQEQFSMSGTSLNNYGQGDNFTSTPGDGTFSFPARLDGSVLFVAHPAGWATKNLKPGDLDNLQIRLQPWASVSGILVDSNAVPVTGMELSLTMFHDWQRGGALVNLQDRITTDAQGRFKFTNIPPARLELQRMVSMGSKFPGLPSTSYTYQLQTTFVAEPGIDNDLGKVQLDHPPPPPPLEQLKDRLGL